MTSLSAFFQKACGISVYKSTFFLQKVLLACSVAFISSVSLLTPVTRRCCSRRSHPIPPSSNNYDILMERWVALLTCESPWHTHTREEKSIVRGIHQDWWLTDFRLKTHETDRHTSEHSTSCINKDTKEHLCADGNGVLGIFLGGPLSGTGLRSQHCLLECPGPSLCRGLRRGISGDLESSNYPCPLRVW